MFSFQRWISQLNNEDNTEACNAKPAVIFPDQSHTLHMYIDVNYKIITAWGLWFFINTPVKLSLLISEYSSVICWGKGSSLEFFQKCELEDCLMAKKKRKSVPHIFQFRFLTWQIRIVGLWPNLWVSLKEIFT